MRLLSNVFSVCCTCGVCTRKKQEDVGMCSSFDLNSHQSAKLLLQLTRLSDITHIAKQMLKNSFDNKRRWQGLNIISVRLMSAFWILYLYKYMLSGAMVEDIYIDRKGLPWVLPIHLPTLHFTHTWLKFPAEYSIQTLDWNIKSNPNISYLGARWDERLYPK